MKNIHNKKILSISIIICISFIEGFIINKNYVTTEKQTLKEIEQLFDKSIYIDKNIREKEHPFFKIYMPLSDDSIPSSLPSDIWNKNTSHAIGYSADTIILIEKTEKFKSITDDEKRNITEQMYLAKINPIRPSQLDSIFSGTLHQNHIPAQTAVIYEIDGIKHYSTSDSSFYVSASKLDDVVIELDHKIVLQGYVKLPFIYIIRQSISFYIGGLGIYGYF